MLIDSYRAMHRTVLPVQVNEYCTDVDFTAKSQEIGKMEAFYREQLESGLAGIKNTSAYLAFGAGITSCVAAYFLHPLLLALAAACFLGGVIRLVGNKRLRRNLELTTQESLRLYAEYTLEEELNNICLGSNSFAMMWYGVTYQAHCYLLPF